MRLKVPGEIVSVAVGGKQFPVDKQGFVEVTAEVLDQLLDAGFTLAPPPEPFKKKKGE